MAAARWAICSSVSIESNGFSVSAIGGTAIADFGADSDAIFPFAASKLHNASDDNVYDSRKIRKFGIIGRVIPLVSGVVERGWRRMQGTFFLFHRHGKCLRRIRLPKECRFGVTEPEVGQYGVVQIQLGQLVGNPVILQPFLLLSLVGVKSCGFRRNTLLQYPASVFDATIEYLLQLVELRFQLHTFHNPSCFIRRYEKLLKKKNVRIIVRTFSLCFSRSDSESTRWLLSFFYPRFWRKSAS